MKAKNPTQPPARKKVYAPPKLMKYGDVRLLTQAGGGTVNEGQGTKKPVGSDRHIKENIVRIGTHPLGIGLYLFDYKAEYRDAYGPGRQFGVMADEVENIIPNAVSMAASGHKVVDYFLLGIRRHS